MLGHVTSVEWASNGLRLGFEWARRAAKIRWAKPQDFDLARVDDEHLKAHFPFLTSKRAVQNKELLQKLEECRIGTPFYAIGQAFY